MVTHILAFRERSKRYKKTMYMPEDTDPSQNVTDPEN